MSPRRVYLISMNTFSTLVQPCETPEVNLGKFTKVKLLQKHILRTSGR